MEITVLTLFPGIFQGPLSESILKRAVDKGIVSFRTVNIRDYAHDRHKVVDDYAYGGGPGMVMKPQPLTEAIDAARLAAAEGTWVVLLSPQGRPFSQKVAEELAKRPNLTLVCGHYEGIDERVVEHCVDEEISLGDFVLTGGEPAAWAIIDAVVRLLPGALNDPESGVGDSFSSGLLQHPQYTRPPEFREWKAPEVLLSGDHAAVARWRRLQAIKRTYRRRPDLLERAGVSPEELKVALELLEDE